MKKNDCRAVGHRWQAVYGGGDGWFRNIAFYRCAICNRRREG